MRILVCTFTYPPNRDGVAAAAEAMVDGLSGLGHEVDVATGMMKRADGIEHQNEIRVHQFEAESVDPILRAQEIARFQSWVRETPFDAVVCHCWYTWLADALREIDMNAPVIMVSHGYAYHRVDWSPKPAWGIGAWARRLPDVFKLPWHLRDYDWVTFLSARPDWRRFFDLRVARMTGYKHYSTIPNGTYPERFEISGTAFRETYGIHEEMLILCVANYSPRKNQELAVRAFRRARMSGAVLVFVGSEIGEYGERVKLLDEQLAKSATAGRVVFLQKVSQELIASAYAASDIFLLSAKEETQPLVLIEAMAARKPWISTDTGGVREMPGGLVASGEADLAAGLQQLAQDPELRRRLGEDGHRACRTKYNWPVSVKAYEELLIKLTSGAMTSTSTTT